MGCLTYPQGMFSFCLSAFLSVFVCVRAAAGNISKPKQVQHTNGKGEVLHTHCQSRCVAPSGSLCSRCVAVLLQAHPPHPHKDAHASSGNSSRYCAHAGSRCSYKLARPIGTGWLTQVQANSWTHRLAQASRRAHQQALKFSGCWDESMSKR